MLWKDIKRVDDAQQNVTKFVFSNDTAVTEAVLYKYPTYRERTVICISTQSGCPVGCRFCGAGDYFVRNLTPRRSSIRPSIAWTRRSRPRASIRTRWAGSRSCSCRWASRC
jgi:L-lysine 2,3-aminomutase